MNILSLLLGAALSFAPILSGQLPSDQIRNLYQDRDGYVWIVGDDGLIRYDGYDCSLFFSRRESEHYGNNFLQTVFEAPNGSFYVGTLSGLYTLSKSSGEISKVDDPLISDVGICRICSDQNGKLWICANKGIFYKGPDDEHFSRFEVKTSKQTTSLSDGNDMLLDNQGNLWITTWRSGLHRYNFSEGKLYSYLEAPYAQAYCMCLDSEGDNMFVGTLDRGILKVDLSFKEDETPKCEVYGHSKGLIDDEVYSIALDAQNGLWCSTRSGISIFRDGKFSNIYPSGKWGDLPYNESTNFLLTRDGQMLLGVLGAGVYKAVFESPSNELFPMEKVRKRFLTSSVKSICPLDEKTYWLGLSGRGLVLYNTQNGDATQYFDIPAFRDFPYSGLIDNSLSIGENIYFANYNDAGIWKYNIPSGTCKIISAANSNLGSDCVRALGQGPDKVLVAGTRQGIYSLDSLDRVTPLEKSLNIQDLDVDSRGNVYAAVNYHGIVRIDPRGDSKFYSAHTMSFNSILVDAKDNVWAGSSHDGLYMYKSKEDDFVSIEAFSFLRGQSVCNLAQSPDGRIWLTTESKVVCFEYDGENFDRLGVYNTEARFNPNSSAYIPSDNCMAFGCLEGIRTYPLCESPIDRLTSSKIVLSTLRTPNKVFHSPQSQELTFPYSDNDVSINFSLMDYVAPDADIYKYRLNDGPWHIVSGVDSKVSYTNLKPGKYYFEVCGTRTGDFSAAPMASLEFRIEHNPWLSWWAWSIYVLLFSGFVCSLAILTGKQLKAKRAAEYEKFAAQKSEEVNQAKLRFFTDVSHEFLTPLSIILASIESLHPHSEQEKNVAEIMSSNAVRLTRLVQQVLEFRKVESGNLRLKVSKGDAADFVGHCVEAFKPLVRKKELTISYSADPTSIEAWFDVDKMDKIVYNLISNAVKYTPKGGTISVSVRLSSDGRLLVSCSNGGKLMGEKTIKGLFKRFYDGDYRKVTAIGTGIGLSLVKELVTLHKGEVKAESGEEFGNRFSFSIPIGKEDYSIEEREEEAPAALPLALSLNEAIVKEDYTVLCVDDSVDLLDLFSVILGKRFDVLTCQSGEEALELMSSRSVDVVVTDVMMPGMDGMALCSYIKEHIEFSHIPVIILSAKTDDASSIEGYNRGADGYMTKPCNFSVLGAMISSLVKKREQQRSKLQNQMVFELKGAEYTPIDKTFLEKAMKVANDHIADENFSQADFTTEMCMSRTVLTEKLKSLTGYTPMALLLNARLQAAYKAIQDEKGNIRVSDLAYSVGFNDAKYFSKSFKAKFGKSPREAMDEFK